VSESGHNGVARLAAFVAREACAAELEASIAAAIERAINLGLVNPGSLIVPFHNMMLLCPVTSALRTVLVEAGFADEPS